jgi:hypothetical protein
MSARKIKWLVYTVLVGLIPIFSRLFAWLITKEGTLDLFAAADFIAFGLVLHISNINEIEHLQNVSSQWKTAQNGFSITFIACYSVLFSVTLIGGGIVSQKALLNVSVFLSIVSFLISYSVYYYLERVGTP